MSLFQLKYAHKATINETHPISTFKIVLMEFIQYAYLNYYDHRKQIKCEFCVHINIFIEAFANYKVFHIEIMLKSFDISNGIVFCML